MDTELTNNNFIIEYEQTINEFKEMIKNTKSEDIRTFLKNKLEDFESEYEEEYNECVHKITNDINEYEEDKKELLREYWNDQF